MTETKIGLTPLLDRATSQRMQEAFRSWERQYMDSLLKPPEECSSINPL